MNFDVEGRKRKPRKRRRKGLVLDEAGSLLRRVRYLLVRMKLEQNLIDAYSAEGWKGKSKEKIRPENELKRAGKQILLYKAGIRDAIRRIEQQSSEGCIEDTVMYPDGSVHHEHIFCAKCKSREAFSDNDIILCDGPCNRAFHQMCLEPPLEKIPPGDQGWLCNFCECKMEILESLNAHVGTSLDINSRWEDIFMEAAAGKEGGNSHVDPAQEWPSEDSDDDDYNPETHAIHNLLRENDSNISPEDDDDADDDNCSNSSDAFCSPYEVSFKSESPVEEDDPQASCFRRQRRDVDYKKLYIEMFGKDLKEGEQSDEDEDWGPRGVRSQNQRQKKGLESVPKVDQEAQERKNVFRIPREAVTRLRRVFAQNKFPSMAEREDLSRELGLSAAKISQWFKNTRYTAIKIRKENSPVAKQVAEMGSKPLLVGQIERLCCLSDKVARLREALRLGPASSPGGPRLVYLPVAELREKVPSSLPQSSSKGGSFLRSAK
ncbi:pathogenesis related homeodomain protein A [Wolffia australiana]